MTMSPLLFNVLNSKIDLVLVVSKFKMPSLTKVPPPIKLDRIHETPSGPEKFKVAVVDDATVVTFAQTMGPSSVPVNVFTNVTGPYQESAAPDPYIICSPVQDFVQATESQISTIYIYSSGIYKFCFDVSNS